MLLQSVPITIFCFFDVLFIFYIDAKVTQDLTTTRPNTLYDDADDIQRQLNNEARSRMIFGKPKTLWVFRPTEFPSNTKSWPRFYRKSNVFERSQKLKKVNKPSNIKISNDNDLTNKGWSYEEQNQWFKSYRQCGGRSQSPVDLPVTGLVASKGRRLRFIDYDLIPQSLKIIKDGTRIKLYGTWEHNHQPLVYGGAAHSRRYVFHSMTLRWPSEHRIGGVQYPLESQVIHISADYGSMEEAMKASTRDHLALLGIVNLYKYKNYTQHGLEKMLKVGKRSYSINASVTPHSLKYFNPPLKEYASYQGSLTVPPCTETVLWLVRGKALPVTREAAESAGNLLGDEQSRGSLIRQPQPLNDRKVFYFN